MSHGATRNQRKRTVITCKAPEAAQVLLAGSFSGWKPEATPMKRRADGQWEAALELAPGRYEYKFVVDGRWCFDPQLPDGLCECPECVPNSFGTLNRVVAVEA